MELFFPDLSLCVCLSFGSYTHPQLPEFKPPNKDIPTLHYKEGRLARDFISYFRSGKSPSLIVVIDPVYMVGTNKQVKSRQLWGDETYTDDSDVVAVLLHQGYYASSNVTCNPLISRFYAQVNLLPPQEQYLSATRNAVRSRCWFAKTEGCSYQVERCWLLTRSNKHIELSKRTEDGAVTYPTYQLGSNDRQMNTRSTTGSSKNKPTNEVTVLYNLVQEPWMKYCLSAIADRGLKSSHWTSSRLREDVLYLESSSTRYELSYGGDDIGQPEVYRFARCRKPLPISLMEAKGVPLPSEELEVLEANLRWDEIVWSNMHVTVRGKPYKMLRMHFMPRCSPGGGSP